MSDWTSFWHMGGYAFYVWSAYGVTFVVLLASFLLPLLHHRALRREMGENAGQNTR